MSRFIAFLCAWTLFDALAQPSAATLYDSLERQYEELVGVYVAGGVCPSRSAEVIQRQRALASALLETTPSTGPRVLLFAVAANSLENVRRLNEAGASRTGDNGSLLHAAARLADPPMLAYLTSIGFGLATDTTGALVLRHALVCRDQSVVDLLIKAGAVPDAKTTEVAESWASVCEVRGDSSNKLSPWTVEG